MSHEEWQPRERRDYCSAHQAMVEHDEAAATGIATTNVKVSAILWLAGAVFLACLGSVGTMFVVVYKSGAIVQSVKHNTIQIERIVEVLELTHPAHK